MRLSVRSNYLCLEQKTHLCDKIITYFIRILIVSTSVSISSIVLLIMPSTNKFRKRLSEAVIAITGFLFA